MQSSTIAAVGSIFLASVLAACGEGAATAPAAPPAPKEVVKVDAGKLFAAYEDNEVATDEAFKGKLVQVSGSVQAIDKDAFNNIVINFKTSNRFIPAHMKMENSEKAGAMALKKGVKASVQCQKMARIMGSPYGSGCRFVAEEEPKGQKKISG